MRESIGGSWLFGTITVFMMIFVGYLVIMINYTSAFKMKNEAVHMIERYEGLSNGDKGSVKLINQYLANSKYTATGKCDCEGADGCYGAKAFNATEKIELGNQTSLVSLKNIKNTDDYYYCVKFYNLDNEYGYYDIELFLNFNLPVLDQIAKFGIKGQTIKIKYPAGTDTTPGYK